MVFVSFCKTQRALDVLETFLNFVAHPSHPLGSLHTSTTSTPALPSADPTSHRAVSRAVARRRGVPPWRGLAPQPLRRGRSGGRRDGPNGASLDAAKLAAVGSRGLRLWLGDAVPSDWCCFLWWCVGNVAREEDAFLTVGSTWGQFGVNTNLSARCCEMFL